MTVLEPEDIRNELFHVVNGIKKIRIRRIVNRKGISR